MGEVFCVATWDDQKEKKLLKWVEAKPDRYVVCVAEAAMPHPRMIQVGQNDFAFSQIVADLIYLPFSYEDPSDPLLQRLSRFQAESHFRSSDFIDQGVRLLTNYRENLQLPFLPASICFGLFSDATAVVCGAGPSLKEAIPTLKQNRDRFLILGCGAGMQALLAAGVRPHLAVHVDADPLHRFSKTDIPLFFQLRTSHEVVSQMSGPKFLMAGAGAFPLEARIEERLGLEAPSDGGWTATTRGVALATAFGCRTIHFAGMDFSGSYAKGVDVKQEGQRVDWTLAAEWLNAWVNNHPEREWGVISKKNPLMPDVPSVELRVGAQQICTFPSGPFQNGKEVWQETAASFGECRQGVDQFLVRLQTIFPKLPGGDEVCQQILRDLEKQPVVQMVLDPIWNYWEGVLKREPDNHGDALVLHRMLLLKSLADQFYAS